MDRGGGGNSPYDNEMENSRPSELLILMNGAMGESPVWNEPSKTGDVEGPMYHIRGIVMERAPGSLWTLEFTSAWLHVNYSL